jgi:8-oxo-dGTP pyrophosphatase MutT (NUDIX family)
MHFLTIEHIPSIDQAFELYSCDREPELDLITSCTTVCVYVNNKLNKNQVILCKSRRGREHPGGRRELGETTEECLRRELEEEVGVTDIDSIQVI